MVKPRIATGLAIFTLLLAGAALIAGAVSGGGLDGQLHKITKAYRFDLVEWEINTIAEEAGKVISGGPDYSGISTAEVIEFFDNATLIRILEAEIETSGNRNDGGNINAFQYELDQRRQINSGMVEGVEGLIESQIREALTELGISNPAEQYIGDGIKFPPVNFSIERPPHLLVISPKERIESVREIMLLPELAPAQIEEIETEADKLGISSLVVRLGGIATYPNFVTDRASLRFVLSTASEEWLHQYLAFTPLGFSYLLDLTGIARNYEIATMNETVAGIVSDEIGEIIYQRYYASGMDNGTEIISTSEFDFNKEMRDIRLAVDAMLAAGEITEAEEYMEMKRQFLAENGYYIRKLNQAYFAFYGAYADAPTSVSPIGAELKELRSRSSSLKEFIDTAASLNSRQELAEIVNR